MRIYKLERVQWVDADLDTVWSFFSNPENLDELTPKDMGFDILTQRPLGQMYKGQIIDYKVSPILNIPMKWRTEIIEVEDRRMFIDLQRKGPYKLWKHTHTFIEKEGKVLMTDLVEYALPLGPLGWFAHWLFVKARLVEIFDFRFKKVDELFNSKLKRMNNIKKAV